MSESSFQQKLAGKHQLSLELVSFITPENDLHYVFIALPAERAQNLSLRMRRKDFQMEKEGIILGYGFGQPDQEEIDRVNLAFIEAIEMLA